MMILDSSLFIIPISLMTRAVMPTEVATMAAARNIAWWKFPSLSSM